MLRSLKTLALRLDRQQANAKAIAAFLKAHPHVSDVYYVGEPSHPQYEHGVEWLDTLLEYLEGNWRYLEEFIKERIPELKLIQAEGTYLAWVDCSALGLNDRDLEQFILDDAGLWLDQGDIFGKTGSGFVRINIATQRDYLARAINQLEKAVNSKRSRFV